MTDPTTAANLHLAVDEDHLRRKSSVWSSYPPLVTAQFNLFGLDAELFGWACGSLVLVALGLLGARWGRTDRALALFALAIVGSSLLYWFNGGPDFGARYWYLVFPPCIWFAAAGLRRTLEPSVGAARAHAFVGAALVGALAIWIPWRAVDKYSGYRGVEPSRVPAAELATLRDALVLVAGRRHPEFAQAVLLNRFEDPRSSATFAFVTGIAVMKELSPFTVVLAVNLEPVYTILIALVIWGAGERMHNGSYIGIALILACLFANGWFQARERRKQEATTIAPIV